MISYKDDIITFVDSIHEHLKGKPYCGHVHDVIPISNCDAADPRMDDLREKIVEVASKQPYWGEERPIKWLMLADRLTQERDARQDEPVLQIVEVIKIAKEFGILGDEVQVFLNDSHNLGDLIHFDEDGLRDMVIMNPQWLINMFRYVVVILRGLSIILLNKNRLALKPLA